MKIENKSIIKKVLFVLLLLLICSFVFFIFKIEIEKEKQNIEVIDKATLLPSPDRIIYKNRDNKYIIINTDTYKHSQIYSELYNKVSNTIDGKVYTEEQISDMQNRGSFIEFDYNTISKNYIFMLDEDEIGVIKRLSNSGQVIKTSLDDKENIIKKIDEFTKKEIKYDFNTEYSLFSENQLSELNDDITIGKTKVVGVYKKLFVNKYDESALKVYLGKLNFKTNQELPNIDLDKQNVVVTVSRYEINNITKNIGNIKYDLGKFSDNYIVNLYIVSKVVNVNCIYFNNSDDPMVETFSTTNKENGIEYYVQNEKYYANINNKKTELISLKRAADIADKEAQKSKYQYQGWKSEFYTRDSDLDEYGISGELILGLDTISKFSHWRDEWQNEEYEDKVMWKIRLFDRNDPLTNLYIYIDALNGNIIGAGAASD